MGASVLQSLDLGFIFLQLLPFGSAIRLIVIFEFIEALNESTYHKGVRFAKSAFTICNDIFKGIWSRLLSSLLVLLVLHFFDLGEGTNGLVMQGGTISGGGGDEGKRQGGGAPDWGQMRGAGRRGGV